MPILFRESQIELLYSIQSLTKTLPDSWWDYITNLGEASLLLMLLIALTFNRSLKTLLGYLATGFFAGFVTLFLKNTLDVMRPAFQLKDGLLHIIGEELCCHSFPSGHTTSASIFSILIMLHFKNKWVNIAAPVFLFLIALSRIAVGAHWPQDVIAAIVLMAVIVPIFNWRLQCLIKNRTIKLSPRVYYNIVIACLLVLGVVSILVVGVNIYSGISVSLICAYLILKQPPKRIVS